MDSINDILSSLTPDDINSLKSMAESIFGSESQDEKNDSRQPKEQDFDSFISPEMLIKLSSVMNILNSQGSERCRLIEALKPNLSQPRRQKADRAMQILKILEILPLISDLNISGDNNA